MGCSHLAHTATLKAGVFECTTSVALPQKEWYVLGGGEGGKGLCPGGLVGVRLLLAQWPAYQAV